MRNDRKACEEHVAEARRCVALPFKSRSFPTTMETSAEPAPGGAAATAGATEGETEEERVARETRVNHFMSKQRASTHTLAFTSVRRGVQRQKGARERERNRER